MGPLQKIIILDESDSSCDEEFGVSAASAAATAATHAVKHSHAMNNNSGHNPTLNAPTFQHQAMNENRSGLAIKKKNIEVMASHEDFELPASPRRISNEGQYSSQENNTRVNDDDQGSLVGMNGMEYALPVDMGEFGFTGGEEDSSSDSDDDDDSSDDGFYAAEQERKKAAVETKSAIPNDVEQKSSVSKTRASFARAASFEEPNTGPSLSSPASSFSCGSPGKESPKSIFNVDSSDDDDFALKAAPTKKRKQMPGPKTTNDGPPPAHVQVPAKLAVNKATSNVSSNDGTTQEDSSFVDKAPPRKRKKIASKSTSSSKKTPPPRQLRISERVCAEWNKDEWYWGVITSVKGKKKKGKVYVAHSIHFFDSYSLDNVGRKRILTEEQFRNRTGRDPPSSLEELKVQVDCLPVVHAATRATGGRLAPREMYVQRCQQCELCTKPVCGACATCVTNKHASPKERQVCLQKMCLCFTDEQKKQPAVGLPPSWTFAFSRNTKYHHKSRKTYVPGLFIYSPEHNKPFRSVEAAVKMLPGLKKFNPNVIADFNRHIGVTGCETGAIAVGGSGDNGSRNGNTAALSIAQIEQHSYTSVGDSGRSACGKCENCTKNNCGKCAMCTSSSSGVSPNCFQKMCLTLPPGEKAKPAVGFPRGWTFYFGKKTHCRGSYRFKPIPGLWIISPGGKEYRTVEAATTRTSKQEGLAGGDAIARKFYNNVGLHERIGQLPQSNRALSSQVLKRKAPPKPSPLESVSTALSKYRVVGSRIYCTVGNQGYWGVIEAKKEVSKNVYEYTVRMEDDDSFLEDVDAESILSEFHYKEKTGNDPPPLPSGHLKTEEEYDSECAESPHKIQRVEASTKVTTTSTTDLFLIGKRFCFAWTDLKNQRKIVHGRVVECNVYETTGEVENFKVMYDAPSRDLVNLIGNQCGGSVPEFQTIQPPLALGACIRYEKESSNTAKDTSVLQEIGRLQDSWNWITPDMLRKRTVTAPDGKRLPRLTVVVRDYQLDLSVEPSTIPNAGYGVFLSCTAAEGEPFTLQPGELVDLGVYAPFRIQDKKLNSVLVVKSFIHAYKPEEWAFDTKDERYQFDITDDFTGDAHDEARSHVPAYVNESDEHGRVCIRAEHDAEGSVHYLLGHAFKSQGAFSMPANGEKREVFVNYGDRYEKTRVRKDYGFEPEKRQHLKQVLKDEKVDDVKEMYDFAPSEVEASAHFLVALFSKEADFDVAIVQLALVCATVFQRRVWDLFLGDNVDGADNDANGTSKSDVDVRKLRKLLDRLVDSLLKMLPDKGDELKLLQAGGDVDRLLAAVLNMEFSADEIAKLQRDGFKL